MAETPTTPSEIDSGIHENNSSNGISNDHAENQNGIEMDNADGGGIGYT